MSLKRFWLLTMYEKNGMIKPHQFIYKRGKCVVKKSIKIVMLILLLPFLLFAFACGKNPDGKDSKPVDDDPIVKPPVNNCVMYVPSWAFSSQQDLKDYDFSLMTHVNYAFSLVSDRNNPIPILRNQDVNRLAVLRAAIEAQGADTKILVSIGGWSAFPDKHYFCEGAATETARENFANECLRWVEEYGIDGIDIDWEYPGEVGGGCTTCPHCVTDFTLLCGLIKEKIGTDKLLTIAAKATTGEPTRLEGAKLAEILDYVNLMNYDYGTDNHASMSRTTQVAEAWGEVFGNKKIHIGLPFYAHAPDSNDNNDNNDYNWATYADIVGYIESGRNIQVYTVEDESYAILDGIKLSFDTPEQIRKKILYVVENGFGGAMVWESSQDKDNDLLNTIASNLNGDGSYQSAFIPIEGLA